MRFSINEEPLSKQTVNAFAIFQTASARPAGYQTMSAKSVLTRSPASDRIPIMPIILVTNDDGVHSPGIASLFHAMEILGDAYVVAPDRERSAVSHALTLHRPLKVDNLKERVFSINGTPTDCVAVAIDKLLPEKPALVVSGINKGGNLGDDITYSGTVSAAMESTIMGIPAFAISLVTRRQRYHSLNFDAASRIAQAIGKYILENPLPYDTLLNVNVPDTAYENIKGIKITRQGKRIYDGAIKETFDPLGEKYYWIGGGKPYWEHGEDTDIQAIQDNHVSATPIHLDLTNYEAIKFLKDRLLLDL